MIYFKMKLNQEHKKQLIEKGYCVIKIFSMIKKWYY